ncbi:hypothetical protein PCL_02761 [Purpureocillium lilacinum]|uniref:Uncharacterized protein n=1 Tax=Purpureocillium lilacinum TaxID=33203 RepID=A0A2U3E003_PURLI|nr:hypothetical protein PCL_02761 [Purpureocillium lilacinum]
MLARMMGKENDLPALGRRLLRATNPIDPRTALPEPVAIERGGRRRGPKASQPKQLACQPALQSTKDGRPGWMGPRTMTSNLGLGAGRAPCGQGGGDPVGVSASPGGALASAARALEPHRARAPASRALNGSRPSTGCRAPGGSNMPGARARSRVYLRRAKTAVRAVVRVGPPALIVQVPNGCPPLPARPCPCPSSSSLPRRRTVKTADNIVAPSPTASSTTTRLTSRFATKTASRAAPPIGADGSPSCPVARLPSQRPSATHAQHTSAVAAAAAALRRALLCERWPAPVALDSYLVPVSSLGTGGPSFFNPPSSAAHGWLHSKFLSDPDEAHRGLSAPEKLFAVLPSPAAQRKGASDQALAAAHHGPAFRRVLTSPPCSSCRRRCMRHHRSRRLSSAIGTPSCRTSDLPVLDTHHTSKDGLPGPDRTVPLPISRSYDAGFRLPSWGSANPTCPSATDFRLRLLDFRFTTLFIPVTLQHWRHLRRRLFHILAYFDDTSTQGIAVQSPSDYARWLYFCSNLLLDFCFNLLLLDSRCFVSSPAPRPPYTWLLARGPPGPLPA